MNFHYTWATKAPARSRNFSAPGAIAGALIKPQSEVGPDRVGKGGVVRDPALHQEVCDRIRAWFERSRVGRRWTLSKVPCWGQKATRNS
jgi:predicted rRNA methylase YqxC with S4 and FtsJ domains